MIVTLKIIKEEDVEKVVMIKGKEVVAKFPKILCDGTLGKELMKILKKKKKVKLELRKAITGQIKFVRIVR